MRHWIYFFNIFYIINFINFFIDYFKSDSINFIAEYIEDLPKHLICDLARKLINLTSLKQKITPEIESVGDEIDLLIIEYAKAVNCIK